MNRVRFVLVLISGLLALNCNSLKNEKASVSRTFLIDNSKTKQIEVLSFQKWNAGQKQGGFGYDIEIIQSRSKSALQLQHIYFRGLKGTIQTGNGKEYIANLKSVPNTDHQLSLEASNAYNNSLPNLLEVPFLLNDNECVISYIDNHTVKFIKVVNLKEKETINYPSAKPRN